MATNEPRALSRRQALLKRGFDMGGALIGLTLTGWIMIIAAVIARIDTGMSGFFLQTRIGRYGKPFRVIKIRTMRPVAGHETTVTTGHDPRITRWGRFFRRTKIDELPQLINVLLGDMSFVGPRPDVPGFADRLEGDDRIVLMIRPGITGPATLKYRDEEQLLASVPDPERYNREVIFPDKVRINREYIKTWSLRRDLCYLWRTVSGS